ncbi:hypothetical protein GLOIN_2v252653 [Rhizophagus irregularis DAOM 181602=DAOM 197198]|uniref:Uncharacterized protein n=1 Tax=Rhizophagus irregularis (strain DAOM 181602 / DAOM 197198 / MUCL 43194) TaxID=747089 RepID=A0A2P4QSM4_RHIID|nr:hypothetical protein GLOIN_2v252653 [Rhizophagus irregularis DAOM 181602=DAOM 197198]POG80625.1 hypothetical protein GLOIN_2v252653 [Rhizophagus irregularis DAOM 181602=DAOM 197198]|eukprot:XP_025187491.1 hypothetical protein GLOIN_2v252653 [Rhizophagus irregularis DAOM 181602=DAOM 197198]
MKVCQTIAWSYHQSQTVLQLRSYPRLVKELRDNATDGVYVDLDSVFFVPKYQTKYKFRKHWL